MHFPLCVVPLLLVLVCGGLAIDSSSHFLRLRKEIQKEPNTQQYLITTSYDSIVGRKEEESYWDRLLQETDMSVAPTPQPPTPTPPPSPAPTDEPTPSPVTPPPTPLPTSEPETPPPTPSPTSTPETPPPTPAPTSTPETPQPTEVPETPPPTPPPTTASPVGPAPTEAPPTGNAPTESSPTVTTPPTEPSPSTPSPTDITPTNPPPTVSAPPTTSPPSTPSEPTPAANTPAPTPGAQTMPPTAMPTGTGECEVSLDVECFSSEGVPCDEIPTGSDDPVEVVFNYTITNNGDVNARPISINSNFSLPTFNLTATINLMGVVVAPGDTYSIDLPLTNLTLDDGSLSVLVDSLVLATNDEGSECSDFDQTVFSIGVPLPTISPAPTPSPTPDGSTAPPTPPLTGFCNPNLVVECFDMQGVPCDVAFPEGGEIGNTTTPQTLTFNYTISNEGLVALELLTLVSNFTEGDFMFNQRVNFTDVVLASGETLPPLSIRVNDVPLDEGRKSFLVESAVFTQNGGGVQCSAEDTSEFFFGFGESTSTPSPTPESVEPPTSVPLTPAPTTAEPPSTPAPTSTPIADATIADVLAGDDRFTTLVSLADELGLIPGLANETLTVFAPTNDAFAALDLPPDTDPDTIRDVLFYHAAEGEVLLEDGLVVETLLNDATVLLTVTEMETKVNDANIEETLPASNGIVYVIDAVLLPPTTPAPSPEPTTLEPTPQVVVGECSLDVDVECFSSEGLSCEEAFPETLECGLQSTSLSFKYIGGDCDESSNSQTVLFFGCVNGDNAPPTTDPVYILVESKDFTIFFSDTVDVGEVFTITDGGDVLPDKITISIFDSESAEAERLQVVQMNPSCETSLLFMNDIFGANQVVGWETEAQGVVDSTAGETLTFIYTITNNGNIDAEVLSIFSGFGEEGGSFTFIVDSDFTDAILAPNASLPFTQDIPDLRLDEGRKTLVVETEVTGDNLDGSECQALDESEFSFGFV